MAVTRESVYRKTAVVVCAAVVLAGCSVFGGSQKDPATPGPSATPGASKTSSPSAVDLINPDKANSLIVPKRDVSEIVGSTLDYEGKSSNPKPPTIEGKQSCRTLMVPLTVDVGDKWTTYRDVWYREDKDAFTHSITQRVLLYSSKDDAAETYSKEFPADVRECAGEDLRVDTATWRVSVRDVSEGRARWVLDEIVDGKPSGWRCMLEARNIDNLLLSVTICQLGNGAPAVKAIVDRMAEAAKPK